MNGTAATAADSRPPTAVRWRLIAVLMAYSFMQHFNRVSMSSAGDEHIGREFGLEPEQLGLIYSAFLLPYTLAMTPGGWFSDRIGPWRTLAFMGIGSGLFCILTGLPGYGWLPIAVTLPALIGIRGAMGVCSAPIYPTSAHAVSLWIPFRQRSLANGLVTGSAFVGIACTYVGFGYLMDFVGWPAAFAVSGSVTLLLGLIWLLFAADRPTDHRGVNSAERHLIASDDPVKPKDGRGSMAPLLRSRSLILLTISYGAIGYFEYLFAYWTHYYFEDVLHLTKSESRIYSAIPPLALIISVPLGGWLSDRLIKSWGYRTGRAAVPIAGMIASALLLFAAATAGDQGASPRYVIALLTLALGAIGTCEGPCWSTSVELGGRNGGTAAGIFNTGGNLGGLLAPYLTPLIGTRFGWFWALVAGSAVCLVGVTLWRWIDPAERVADEVS
jgi:sugar phosphate permease